MSKKTIILVITLSIIFASFSAVNAAELQSVNYLISGDSLEINTLQFPVRLKMICPVINKTHGNIPLHHRRKSPVDLGRRRAASIQRR